MNRSPLAPSLTAIALLGLLSGCAGSRDAGSQSKEMAAAQPIEVVAQRHEPFDAGSFTRPTQIDNEWLPLKPGTRLVYEGTTQEEDGTLVPHRVVWQITDLTKMIAGIQTVVAVDLDYSNGVLEEAELALYAQDDHGTVWHLGQYPEVYEDGKLVGAPAWIHGIEEARAGITMHAQPRLGTPSYSEGWGPAVAWTDRGQVDQVGQKLCGPSGCYEDVLVITETSIQEPGAEQLKFYARGVGCIRVGWRGAGEKTKETLELVRIEHLDPKALAALRAKALELERSAYQHSTAVYARTSPLEQPPSTTGSE